MSLRRTLTAISEGSVELSWDSWLTLVLSADDDPASWSEAWPTLDQEVRVDLLTGLAVQAGPLADALAQVLATRVGLEPDPQLRETLYQDAAGAADRTTARLTSLRDRLATEAALDHHLNLSAEITALAADRDRLLADLAGDPEHQRKTALEQEIGRLTAFRTSLLSYDRPAREAEREQLEAETATLNESRSAVEHRIREAQEANSAAQVLIRERESQLAALNGTLAQEQDRSDQLAAEAQQTAQQAQELRSAISALHARLAHERAETARQTDELAATDRLLASEIARRDALQQRIDDLLPERSRLSKELITTAERYAEACAAAEQDLRQTSALHAQLLAQLGLLSIGTESPARQGDTEPEPPAPDVAARRANASGDFLGHLKRGMGS